MLAAVAVPLDRPADLLRRPDDQRHLREQAAAQSETAAHIGADQAQSGDRHFQRMLGEQVAVVVRPLGAGPQGVTVGHGIVFAERRPRFHRVLGQPADLQVGGDDVGGCLEDGLDRLEVAHGLAEADIVAQIGPDQRCIGIDRVRRFDHRRQFLIVDLDQFRRVAGLVHGFGDDEGDRIADELHRTGSERRPVRFVDRRTVRPFERHQHRRQRGQSAQAVGLPVVMGQHRQHAGCGPRRRTIDAGDAGMGMGRAQNMAAGLAGPVEIVGILPAAAQQSRILIARHALSQAEFHAVPPLWHRRSQAGADVSRPPAPAKGRRRRRGMRRRDGARLRRRRGGVRKCHDLSWQGRFIHALLPLPCCPGPEPRPRAPAQSHGPEPRGAGCSVLATKIE